MAEDSPTFFYSNDFFRKKPRKLEWKLFLFVDSEKSVLGQFQLSGVFSISNHNNFIRLKVAPPLNAVCGRLNGRKDNNCLHNRGRSCLTSYKAYGSLFGGKCVLPMLLMVTPLGKIETSFTVFSARVKTLSIEFHHYMGSCSTESMRK